MINGLIKRRRCLLGSTTSLQATQALPQLIKINSTAHTQQQKKSQRPLGYSLGKGKRDKLGPERRFPLAIFGQESHTGLLRPLA